MVKCGNSPVSQWLNVVIHFSTAMESFVNFPKQRVINHIKSIKKSMCKRERENERKKERERERE